MTIKDGIKGFPSYFINGLIYGAKTDLLEDGLREDAVKQTHKRTESVKAPLSRLWLHYCTAEDGQAQVHRLRGASCTTTI